MEGPLALGRYVLYEAFASGGMAAVHLGRLVGPVGFSRTVAIKRLHQHLARDPEFVAMFLDEARLAARVRHPNVVPVLDVVASENEVFLVMEFVQGESLSFFLKRARLRGEPLPISLVTQVIGGALHGLHAAHEAKDERGDHLHLVHRDVSPQNIMVGSDGVPRVVDFGVAKANGRSQETRAGQVKGKMQYMAPEQMRGHEVSRAADVYGAGVVLWEALTNERLFAGANDADTMYQVLERTPPTPSSLRREIPPSLDAIVLRALSKDPAKRFATAEAFASALEAAIPALPVSAIAAWVKDVAGDSLVSRAKRVEEVESDVSRPAFPPPAAAPSDKLTVVEDLPTLRTPASASGVVASEPARQSDNPFARRSTRPIWISAGAALLLGTLLAIFLLSRSGPDPRAEPAAAPIVSSPPPAATPEPAPTPSASPPPPAASTPAPAPAVATPEPTEKKKRPIVPGPRSGPPRSTDGLYQRD